jgi:hypothetical protein
MHEYVCTCMYGKLTLNAREDSESPIQITRYPWFCGCPFGVSVRGVRSVAGVVGVRSPCPVGVSVRLLSRLGWLPRRLGVGRLRLGCSGRVAPLSGGFPAGRSVLCLPLVVVRLRLRGVLALLRRALLPLRRGCLLRFLGRLPRLGCLGALLRWRRVLLRSLRLRRRCGFRGSSSWLLPRLRLRCPRRRLPRPRRCRFVSLWCRCRCPLAGAPARCGLPLPRLPRLVVGLAWRFPRRCAGLVLRPLARRRLSGRGWRLGALRWRGGLLGLCLLLGRRRSRRCGSRRLGGLLPRLVAPRPRRGWLLRGFWCGGLPVGLPALGGLLFGLPRLSLLPWLPWRGVVRCWRLARLGLRWRLRCRLLPRLRRRRCSLPGGCRCCWRGLRGLPRRLGLRCGGLRGRLLALRRLRLALRSRLLLGLLVVCSWPCPPASCRLRSLRVRGRVRLVPFVPFLCLSFRLSCLVPFGPFFGSVRACRFAVVCCRFPSLRFSLLFGGFRRPFSGGVFRRFFSGFGGPPLAAPRPPRGPCLLSSPASGSARGAGGGKRRTAKTIIPQPGPSHKSVRTPALALLFCHVSRATRDNASRFMTTRHGIVSVRTPTQRRGSEAST